jgi:glycosyltransferase involved in cell wall biosynthesis
MNISFVIPVYNGEKFLSGAVSSIFNGNIAPGDEVIIVDDKSTDNSKSIALKLKKKFGNITILENECNLGEGLTKNIAISLANSGLIFTLDQDNILSKDSIYELRKYLVKNEIDLASFPEVHYFYRFKGMTTHKQFFTKGIFVNDDLPSVNLNIGCNGNFLFKKEAYFNILFC